MSDTNRADIDAMLRTARGNEEAFGELIHRHQNPLLNFFRRLGATTETAEDLVQDTFLRLYQWRTRYEPKAKFRTFLYMLARHAWADHLRKRMRRPKLNGAQDLDQAPHPRGGSEASDRRMDIQGALGKLSEKLRSVVVLNVYQGLAYREIAEALDIPEGTVKSRMFLALRELRGHLEEDGANHE